MADYNPSVDIQAGKELISEFKGNLPDRVDPASTSTISKVPFKAFILRETLLHRITELGETAVELYDKGNRIISAFLITRAVHETAALFYWFYERLSNVVKNDSLGDFDDFIMEILFGWKIQDNQFPTAYNIMTAIDKLDKKLGNFRDHYERLSEFCHPNYSGVHGAYGRSDHEKIWVDLGQDVTRLSPIVGLPPLIASLNIFKHFYNESANILPRFIEICEENIQNKT